MGPKKGSIEKFVENMPGCPDNFHYDGEGLYWIELSSSPTYSWELALRYPIIWKALAMIVKYVGKPDMEKNGGAVAVDLEENLKAHYYDAHFSVISSAIKIGNHLYCSSLHYPFILRLDLNKYISCTANHHHRLTASSIGCNIIGHSFLLSSIVNMIYIMYSVIHGINKI